MGRFYWLLIIFILSFSLTNAQDDVIEHPIQKGETVYRISKIYGVTVEAIFALNPGSREVIYSGDTLRIPKVDKVSNATINNSGSTDYTKYLVSRGDTKTSLARKFGVSIASLEQQNPQIVPTLMAGQVLKIDKNYKVRPPVEHFVNKGETLWGIATANKICVDELITANNDRLSGVLKAGQTLVIPDNSIVFTTDGDYIVKSGDTKWRLSKRFHMSIAQLEAKNPQIVRMLMACQLINIDINAPAIIETEPQENTVEEEETAPVNPTVEDRVAETKEEVVRDSLETSEETETPPEVVPEVVSEVVPEDVSEEKAPVANDSIPASEDDEIIAETTPETTIEDEENSEEENVEQNPITTPTQNTSEETGTYIDYVIQPNETLFGLSKKAGMSMAAFTDLNPELSEGVAAGAVIKMPKNTVAANNNQDTESSTIATSEVITVNPNETLYKRLDKNKKTGLYICLPFSLEEYQDGNYMQDDATQENEDRKKYIDFYQGAEMAIDSARTLGLNFDFNLIKNSASGRFPRIKVDNASEENAVIVPFLKPSQTYPKIISKNPTAIIDVSPQNISSDDNIVYSALASERELKTRTLKFITSKNAQIVVVSDLEDARNKDLILEYAPDAKFVKVDKTGFFEGKGLTPALDKNKLNYIILDTDRTIVFLNATTEFMGKLSDYDIEMVLIESASLPKQGQVSDIRFRILKLIFPSLMPMNKDEAVLQFEQAYQTRYQTEASEDAIIGFDTTLDVLLRLSQSTGFQNSVENVNSNQINLKFKYQKSEDNNFENKGIYLLQFGDGNRIIEID